MLEANTLRWKKYLLMTVNYMVRKNPVSELYSLIY